MDVGEHAESLAGRWTRRRDHANAPAQI